MRDSKFLIPSAKRKGSIAISLLMPAPAIILWDCLREVPLVGLLIYSLAVGVAVGALEYRLIRRAWQCVMMLAVGVLASPLQELLLGDVLAFSMVFAGAGLFAAGDVNRVMRHGATILLLRASRPVLGCLALWGSVWLCAAMVPPSEHGEQSKVLLGHIDVAVIVTVLPVLALIGMDALVIRAANRRARRQPRACPICGYDLTGNESGVCPECGHVLAESDARAVAAARDARGLRGSAALSIHRIAGVLLHILVWLAAISVLIVMIRDAPNDW